MKAPEESEHMKSERQVLTQLDHPFMIKLYHAFQTDKYLCFVMEFARGTFYTFSFVKIARLSIYCTHGMCKTLKGGEIYYHLSKSRTFNIRRSRLYGAEITSAFEYLHRVNKGLIFNTFF